MKTRHRGSVNVIAIVEDDRAVRESIDNLLESAGFAVLTSTSAEDFLESGAANYVACLVLDVRLPGISGLELQQRLSKGTEAVPIIFVSAHGDEEARERALQEGAVGFFHKPFKAAALLDAVYSTLP